MLEEFIGALGERLIHHAIMHSGEYMNKAGDAISKAFSDDSDKSHKYANNSDFQLSCDDFGGLFTEEYLLRLLSHYTNSKVYMSDNTNWIGVPKYASYLANHLKSYDGIQISAQEICQAGTVRELYDLISSRY
jgi:hypothetical protein